METIEITPARRDDAEQILAVQRAAYQLEAELYGDLHLPPLTETVDELLAAFDTHTILVARHSNGITAKPDGRIVGSVRAQVVRDTARIGRLSVEPRMHGQGIGRQLLRAIERSVLPVERYVLFTGHLSERNLRMYERAGYRQFRTKATSEKITLVFLEKPAVQEAGLG